MDKNEINNYYNKMNKIFGGRMDCKLPFEKIERRLLNKKEAITDPHFGHNPNERSVEELIKYGIINLNKPSGPT